MCIHGDMRFCKIIEGIFMYFVYNIQYFQQSLTSLSVKLTKWNKKYILQLYHTICNFAIEWKNDLSCWAFSDSKPNAIINKVVWVNYSRHIFPGWRSWKNISRLSNRCMVQILIWPLFTQLENYTSWDWFTN